MSPNSNGSRDSKKTILEVPYSIAVFSSKPCPFPRGTTNKIGSRIGVAPGKSSAKRLSADFS
jgi:hypothetical protein